MIGTRPIVCLLGDDLLFLFGFRWFDRCLAEAHFRCLRAQHRAARCLVMDESERVRTRIMSSGIGGHLRHQDPAEIDIGDHQPLFRGLQVVAVGGAIRAEDPAAAAADFHELRLLFGLHQFGVDLLVLAEQRIFGEGLKMLPAAECPDAANLRVVDEDVAAVAFTEDAALDMGGLQLPPSGKDRTVGGDMSLGHVEAATAALGGAKDHLDAIPPRGIGDRCFFSASGFQRLLRVDAKIVNGESGRNHPDLPGIAGQLGLGKDDELDTLGAGLVDQCYGLLDAASQIHPHRCGLNSGDFNDIRRHLHDVVLLLVMMIKRCFKGQFPPRRLDEPRVTGR